MQGRIFYLLQNPVLIFEVVNDSAHMQTMTALEIHHH